MIKWILVIVGIILLLYLPTFLLGVFALAMALGIWLGERDMKRQMNESKS
jgi:hypothetical protein